MLKKNIIGKVSKLALSFFILTTSISCNEKPTTSNKLELWTMQLKPTFNDYMNNVIESFKQKNPGMEIEWVDLPAKEIEQKTLTSIAGGKSPDVVNLNPNFTSKLSEVGALADLETLVSSDIKERYFENIWKSSTINGKTYGFPWYLSTAITMYNKELLEKSGLSSPPKNYQELKTMGETLKSKTGKYIYTPNFGDSGKILEYMVQEGIKLISEDKTKAEFNTPEAEKFINFWIELANKKIIPKDSITQGHREAIDRFQAGESALMVSGPQFLKIIKENAPKLYEKIGVSKQLTGSSGKVGVGVMNLVIPDKSKNKEKAVELAKFITNSENQLAFSKIVTILPSVKEAANNEYFTNIADEKNLEEYARKISSNQLEEADVLLPSVNKWSELRKIFDQYFQQAFLGQISAKEALKKAEEEWNMILEKNNKE